MFCIRFFEKYEWAKQFCDGKLFMNTMRHHRTEGKEGQNDVLEGIIATKQPQKLFKEEALKFGSKYNARYQACGYQYCNILCMSMVTYTRIPIIDKSMITMPGNMKNFGDYGVLIKDMDEFKKRIIDAANKQGFRVVCGIVNYHTPEINGTTQTTPAKLEWVTKEEIEKDLTTLLKDAESTYDSFDKHKRFAFEREWRVSLYRGKKEMTPFVFDVGTLKDITKIIERKTVQTVEGMVALISNETIVHSSNEEYCGNISRRGLRELFYQLGDNKAVLRMGI